MEPKAIYLFILVGRDCDKLCLFEHVRPELAVRQFQNVVCPHEMKTRLVLVHGVEYRLKVYKTEKHA